LANFQDGLNAYNKQDYAVALKEWQPLAKQGNKTAIFAGLTSGVMSCPKLKIGFAQNNLGTMYANGKGVLKDDKQAASWYQKAAEQENAGAQYNLGNMYDAAA
jgi:TPR repeat protein